MAQGSGLCSQFGFKSETVVGTAVTVSTFLKHTSAGGDGLGKLTAVDEGLGACATVITDDRRVVVGTQAQREVSLGVGSKGFGQLWKTALGSTTGPTAIAASTAYRQIHTPGDLTGDSLTVQLGMPESSTGTVRPYTYRGCKVTEWELSQAKNDILKLSLSLDAWAEDTVTALATAAFPTGAELFHWKSLAVTIGGTASVASGLTSVTGGVALKGLRSCSVKGTNALVVDRFLAGGAGTKSEQLENGFRSYTGELDLEFADRTQVYDLYAADTSTPLVFTWTGAIDAGSGNFNALQVIIPKAKFDTGSPMVGGPDVLDAKTTWTAYGDPAGTLPPIQVMLISAETTL